jgi:RNA polymerase sigma-70 factor, ECF subfamily
VLDQIMPLVYRELRRLAQAHLRRERPDHTLQPTALVHEVYLRLAAQHRIDGTAGPIFLALASRMMRRILVDYATRRNAQKRVAGLKRVPLEDQLQVTGHKTVDVIDLDRALTRLSQIDSRQGQMVELRFFGGLTIEETATVLDVSTPTVEREWATARLWLARRLDQGSAR